MSFVKLAAYHPRAIVDVVTISLGRSPSNPAHSLKVRLGVEVADAIGVAAGGRLDLLWGQEDDVGRILLRNGGAELGVKLKRPGRTDTGTVEAGFGNLPRKPLLGPHGRQWTLERGYRRTARAPWAKKDGGVLVTLPIDWWSIEDSQAATAERVKELRLKGADDAAIMRATKLSPEQLEAILLRLREEMRTSREAGAELDRIRKMGAVPLRRPA